MTTTTQTTSQATKAAEITASSNRFMRTLVGLSPLLAGVIFGAGLGISGMTQPSKVVGFLDILGGHWDPSLALVMAGAIAVHMPAYWWLRRRGALKQAQSACGPGVTESRAATSPIAEEGISASDDGPGRAPGFAGVDVRTLSGAAIFGVGWALAGYCPGPAIVTLVSFSPGILVFVASMMSGMWLFHLLLDREPAQLPAPAPRTSSEPAS